jgi:tetratricopeptide (TPR) repeat protein
MDYSKFDKIGENDEEEERKAREEDAKRAKDEVEKVRKVNRGIEAADGAAENEDEDSDDELSPLFWTKPPNLRKNPSKKALAMQELLENMVYDRPPEELAEDFKERGNISFKQDKYKDAMTLYTEALEWAYKAWSTEKDVSGTIGTILSNRSAVQLKQKNYRSAIKEAEASLKVSPNGPSSNKARYRGTRACLALNKPDEAFKKFLTGVAENSSSKQDIGLREEENDDDEVRKNKRKLLAETSELASVMKEAQALREKLVIAEHQKSKDLLQEKQEDALWRERFASHGINLGPLTMDLQPLTGGAEKTGGRGPNPKILQDGTWAWQTIFMYPEYSQSDFIQAFEECNTLRDVLNTMFPPGATESAPWDLNNAYNVTSIEVFFRERATVTFDLSRPLKPQNINLMEEEEKDVATRRWFRVPLEATLGEVLHNSHYVIPGLPVFVVVSKANTRFYKLFLESCREKDGPIVDLKVN